MILRRSIALVVIALAIVAASALRVFAMERFIANKTVEDTYYLPPNDWLAAFSLGHEEAVASALYPRARVYFGAGVSRKDGSAAHVFKYAEAMLHLDPMFREVYPFIATAAVYRQQKPTPEELTRLAELVREGAAKFPNDGKLAWNAGATLAYEITNFVSKAEAEKLQQEAQPYFARAVELGEAPPWMALGTASKLHNLGQTERAIEQLVRVIPMVDDEAERQALIARLVELRAEAEEEGLLGALTAMSEAHQREAPYIPLDFFVVMGGKSAIPALPLDLLGGR